MAVSLEEVGGILEVVALILSHLVQDVATTTYWVVVDVTAGASVVIGILMSEEVEDSGAAAGWGIADTARDRHHDATTGPFHGHHTSREGIFTPSTSSPRHTTTAGL